jgi:uncharacterized protein YvpB/uncharacterized protein YukE
MTILIRPPELRHISETLRASANNINSSLQAIDSIMGSLKGNVFLGNRADALHSRYAPKRDALLRAKDIIIAFANDLQTAATIFENADRGQADISLPFSGGSFWRDLEKLPTLPILPVWPLPPSKPAWPVYPVLPVPPFQPILPIDPWENIELPDWLDKILKRLFPPTPPSIVTPLGLEGPTTGFGELLQQFSNSTENTMKPLVQEQLDFYHSVPIKGQGDLYGSAACTPTSISMVLDYYNAQSPDNKTINPDEIIKMMDESDGTYGKGISPSRLTDELNDLGYQNITQQVGAQYSDLKSALNDGPVIVTTGVKIVGPGTVWTDTPRAIQGAGNTLHAVVVTGINDEVVVVNDPWTGKELSFSSQEFEAMWRNGSNGIYSIRP